MIVAGYFIDVDYKNGIKALFVTDDKQSLYVQSNLPSVYEKLFPKLEMYDLTSIPCLLRLKEIDGFTISESPIHPLVKSWYILDAMVFGD